MTSMLNSKNRQSADGKLRRKSLFGDVACANDAHRESAGENDYASSKPPKLTGAEQRVIALVARAMTNKEIASCLGISPATVKRHLEKIHQKLGLRNRVEAAIYALMLNGCPHKSSSGCAIYKLQAAGNGNTFSWAD
jgi:DNA-binding NarL/FixJ family response regulator